MGLVSKPKLEGFGLDSQFPFTVRGTGQGWLLSSSFKKNCSPSMVSNQQSCLTSHTMISLIYICSLCFFTYGKNYRVFHAILFDIISKIFNIAFSSVWKRCFSPVVLKVFNQNLCLDQLSVSFNFEV